MRKVDLTQLTEDFPIDQVDFRPSKSGIDRHGHPFIQLYGHIDSRTVQRRLDEVVGSDRWQTKMVAREGGVICELIIEVEQGRFVAKCDGAPITDHEGFKGACSKALVRAATQFGIGRYLLDMHTTFAEFVDEDHPEGRTTVINGKTFFWVPPGINPDRKVERHVELEEEDFEDVSNEVVPFGYTKGKRLCDLNSQEFDSLRAFYQKVSEPKGKAALFRTTFLRYLKQRRDRRAA